MSRKLALLYYNVYVMWVWVVVHSANVHIFNTNIHVHSKNLQFFYRFKSQVHLDDWLIGLLWFERHLQQYFSYIVMGTQHHGQLGFLARRAYPTRAPNPKTLVTSLSSESPHVVRVCRESNPNLPIHSPARNLYATAAVYIWMKIDSKRY